MPGTKLVLFDIDGTLLSIANRELNVFGRALEQAYGSVGSIDDYGFAGKTDHQIVFELLSRVGRPAHEVESGLSEMKDRYFEMLAEMLEVCSMRVLPGVVELLDDLAAEPAVVLGLQTGNWEVAAELKLSRFGLDKYFVVGAFGDGHLDRNSLPPLALERARRQVASQILSEDTVIIGDTTLDVACARNWEMGSVGVATGSTSQVDLAAAGADLVVPTLAEVDLGRLLDLLSGEPD